MKWWHWILLLGGVGWLLTKTAQAGVAAGATVTDLRALATLLAAKTTIAFGRTHTGGITKDGKIAVIGPDINKAYTVKEAQEAVKYQLVQ